MAGVASVPLHGEFSVGRVFARAGAMVRRRLGAMLIVALLLAALPVPIRLFGADAFAQGLRGGGSSQYLFYLLSLLAGAIFGALCAGSLIWLGIGGEDGQRIDAADAFYLTLMSAPRLIGLALMIQIAVVIATMLLVVPGIMLGVALTAAMPAAVIEGRAGTRAFDRSFDLTKGARWQIFALWLLFWAVLGGVGYLIRNVFGAPELLVSAPPIGFILAEGAVAIASSIAAAMLESSVYIELRTWKEGAPSDELRDIFA